MEIDLNEIEPLIACPFSPGNVKPVRELAGLEVQQAMIGSSTNSSYEEIMTCAFMLEKIKRNMSTFYHVIPGSRQLLETIDRDKGLLSLIKSGARISEPSCNACIGIGNAPGSEVVSVRSFPRNWEGRSGTEHDQVYLSSCETATAAAIKGEIIDPRDLGIVFPNIKPPSSYVIDDSMIVAPKFAGEIRLGPNIKMLPEMPQIVSDQLKEKVVIKVGDNISTDHILPGGEEIMSLRSNIEAISEYMFRYLDKGFVIRCKALGGGIIIGGKNYGQGSSREHAAIAPMHLGIKAVFALSFARIHRSNLINWGILPIEFSSKEELEKISVGDELEIKSIHNALKSSQPVEAVNKTNGKKISCSLKLKEREKQTLLKGNYLNYIKQSLKK